MRPNRVVRYLLPHCISGFAIAMALVLGLLVFDVMGLRTLAQRSPEGGVAVAMLVIFNGLTFASVQMGAAIMMLGRRRDNDDEDDDLKGGGGPPLRAPVLVPVPVRVRAPAQQRR